MVNPEGMEEAINEEHREIEELLRRTFKEPVEAVGREISKTKDSLAVDIKGLRTTLRDFQDRLDAMERALGAQDGEREGLSARLLALEAHKTEGLSARLVAVEATMGQHQGRYVLALALLGLLELGTLAAVLWQGR